MTTVEEKQIIKDKRKELFGNKEKIEVNEPDAFVEVLRFTATHSALPKILRILREYTNEEVEEIARKFKDKKRKKEAWTEGFRKEKEIEEEVLRRRKV